MELFARVKTDIDFIMIKYFRRNSIKNAFLAYNNDNLGNNKSQFRFIVGI